MRCYHDILPAITIISWAIYSDSEIIDILQEIARNWLQLSLDIYMCGFQNYLNHFFIFFGLYTNVWIKIKLSSEEGWWWWAKKKIIIIIFFIYLFPFLNIDIWHQCIDKVPQDEILQYIIVSIFWHIPNINVWIVFLTTSCVDNFNQNIVSAGLRAVTLENIWSLWH